ncbi:glycosyl transferase group 1 [Denitrovibrio acetiphilus DSM 12809]|uniref:Glycosyl transferase group 1 n=1 Tax=Denitrovibrio acetiphilus (strain DSM 12809 / NBRC 114555 / N2460) TaxID=522772 RepID=D4H620_DENA2|nr:glycosyltransferase family 4 protein [Denitrovibrio acetiphilus]ADD67666.1 glycosyl transferase group 1 [Denitrovibrio acetiphilus DSM 12809]
MNICYINFNKNWGGVKTWSLDFGRSLQDNGHSVTAVVRPETGFDTACKRAGFDTRCFNPGMKCNPVSIFKIIRILKKKKIDVAIVNISKDLNVGAVACFIAGVRVFHRIGLPRDIRNRMEDRLMHKIADGVIVPSAGLKRALQCFDFMDANKINVLYNSKNKAVYLPKEHVQKHKVVIGVTSQLTSSKGHIYLLQAVRRLRDEGYNFLLKIAGRGNLHDKLNEYITGSGLEDNVVLSGFQSDIPAFLDSLDIYVLPSLMENFPNSLLEAMFTGLPCIATDVGAVSEILGEAGIIVEPVNIDALYTNIKNLIENVRLRADLGRKARARCLEKYDIDVNIMKFEDILKEAAR